MKHLLKFLRFLRHEMTKKPSRIYVPYRVNYHEKWFVPPLALYVGIFMVLYATPYGFGVSIFMPDFYIAAIPSAAAAGLMMGYIVRRTYRLDDKHPWVLAWWPRPWRRILPQLYHGIAVPAFAVLIFYAFYFVVRRRPELFWRYLTEDFPYVGWMLLGFNALLWTYYRLRAVEIWKHWGRNPPPPRAEPEEEVKLLAGVEVIPYGERIKDQVALFEPDSRKNKSRSVGFDDERGIESRTLIDIEKDVHGPHFFMIHRALIINRKLIVEVRNTKQGVFLLLGEPRAGAVERVSNGNRKQFLEWYDAG